MNHTEKLDYLIEQFKEDSVQYRNLEVPDNISDKQRILRSLMNIRPPRKMNSDIIRVQNEYLQERNAEIGAVHVEDIPTIREKGSNVPFANKISIWQGDITRLDADAIVNAANSQMLGCFVPLHACIDNCIHTYAGIQLRAECNRQMEELREKYGQEYEQPTAVPMLTDAYNLPARNVVHIVGPIVDGELTAEHERLLAKCYRSTLDMCAENSLKTVAFCCISTGVFHFPKRRAAEIAVSTVTEWLCSREDSLDRVIFNVFNNDDKKYYEEELY